MLWKWTSFAGLRRLSAVLLATSTLSLLSSCASVSGTSTALKETPPGAAVSDCPELPEMESGEWATVRRYLDDVMSLYGECRDKHAESVRWVKRKF